jgi:hypothetical protein
MKYKSRSTRTRLLKSPNLSHFRNFQNFELAAKITAFIYVIPFSLPFLFDFLVLKPSDLLLLFPILFPSYFLGLYLILGPLPFFSVVCNHFSLKIQLNHHLRNEYKLLTSKPFTSVAQR